MPTLPPSSDNEVWYLIPGRKARPRNHMTRPATAAPTKSGGKAREAGRGSSSNAAPAGKSNHRRREGFGEGDFSDGHPNEMRSTPGTG